MHDIEDGCCDLTLPPVLRMVRFGVILSAPADEKNHRNSIDILIHQAYQRIDGIPLSAVLHVHQRDLLAGKIVARRQCHRISLIRCDNVPISAMRQCVIAEAVQVAVRHTGKVGHAVLCQTIKYLLLVQHLTSSHLPQSLFLCTA